MDKVEISDDVDCDLSLRRVNPDNLEQLEKLIFLQVDESEQAFINLASILTSFYGDVVLEFAEKWNRS